jgi:hypothetical protein
VALGLATLACFWPTLGNDFVQYDDQDYVTQNPHIQSGLTWQSIRWAFGAAYAANWHPLTWISHALDVELFGLDPAGHHLSSLLLHAANAVLLFTLLNRVTRRTGRSFLVAGLFALHPLRVESVAWVAERKDVLSGFFFLLALLAYTRFVFPSRCARDRLGRAGNAEPAGTGCDFRSAVFYCLALAGHAAGLMSKPMVVTLPFVLLLMDYWPLGRLGGAGRGTEGKTIVRLLIEKVPFLVLSGISAAITFQAQAPAKVYFAGLPFSLRLANAAVACARYLGKTFWPADLAVFYPHPGRWPTAVVLMAALAIVALTFLVVGSGRRHPWLGVGWLWFLGMLVPVLGLVQVGVQSMADRYTYLPSIGLFIAVVWACGEWAAFKKLPRPLAVLAAAAALAACGTQAWLQSRIWANTETLFTHAASVTRGNWVAHYNLALLAMHRYQTLQRGSGGAAPTLPEAQTRGSGNGPTAPAGGAGPGVLTRDYLGETIAHCRAALRGRPGYVDAQVTLAKALTESNQLDEARTCLEAALAADPRNAEARQNLGEIHHRQGRNREAVGEYRRALELKAEWPEVMNNLAWILATNPDPAIRNGPEALHLAEEACGLTQRTNVWMLSTLAAAYAEVGDFAQAVATAEELVRNAEVLGLKELLERTRRRLELYRSQLPLRES